MKMNKNHKVIGAVAATGLAMAGLAAATLIKAKKNKDVKKPSADKVKKELSEVFPEFLSVLGEELKSKAEEGKVKMLNTLASEAKNFDEFYEQVVKSPVFKKITSVTDLERIKSLFDSKK